MNPRWSNRDRNWGPWQYTPRNGSGHSIALIYEAMVREDHDAKRNVLHMELAGRSLRLYLPAWLKSHAVRHTTNWDPATVARMGRNWYDEFFPRKFGFYVYEGHFLIHYGAYTHSSDTTKTWSMFLPWTQWHGAGESWFDTAGQHVVFFPESVPHEVRRKHAEVLLPVAHYQVRDYDDKVIGAKVTLTERYSKRGTGWFKWMSLIWPTRTHRSVNVEFDAEVGPQKGSWKGGLMGCSIEPLPGESVVAAFDRLCIREGVVRLLP